MIGKKKCRILKEIRQKIADENDIPYVTQECRFQGECSGTCPKCESELRYLEKQLAERAAAGKRIAVAALCAGMTFSMAGCTTPFSSKEKEEEVVELSGEVAETDYMGGMEEDPGEEPGEETVELSGDVAAPEETTSVPAEENTEGASK